jgi:hypothetical protein
MQKMKRKTELKRLNRRRNSELGNLDRKFQSLRPENPETKQQLQGWDCTPTAQRDHRATKRKTTESDTQATGIKKSSNN